MEIEYLDENVDEAEAARLEFEETYFETACKFKERLTQGLQSANSSVSEVNSGINLSAVKLPPLDLPLFVGDYDKWVSFYDTFVALILANNNLTNVQKFYYLQSCLKNKAAQRISSIQITDSNYKVAFDLLKERYENKRLIIHSHMRLLFEMPVVSRVMLSC